MLNLKMFKLLQLTFLLGAMSMLVASSCSEKSQEAAKPAAVANPEASDTGSDLREPEVDLGGDDNAALTAPDEDAGMVDSIDLNDSNTAPSEEELPLDSDEGLDL